MKRVMPEIVEEGRIGGPARAPYGMCVLRRGSAQLRVIFSDGSGWDHVSVSLATRCPTWEEMCFVKDTFFDVEEAVMQVHPPKSDYVNNHRFCLHLWKPHFDSIPLPDAGLVGVKELGVLK